MQIHLRSTSFLIMLSSAQFLWCDTAKRITEPALLPDWCPLTANAGLDMTWGKVFCRFQKIGDCTSLLEVGNLTLYHMPCKAGKASAGPMLHALQWLTMASCPSLPGEAAAWRMQHGTDGGWLTLPCNFELTVADSRRPEPSSCCAALQVWLGLFPVQTVMIAVVCVSCVLLSPRVDVEARTLQVRNLGMACICSIKP